MAVPLVVRCNADAIRVDMTIELPNVHCITLGSTCNKTRILKDHLDINGIKHPKFIRGIDAHRWGLVTQNKYLMDSKNEPTTINPKHVGLHLSHYIAWTIQAQAGYKEMTILEDDCRFASRWRDAYSLARKCLPDDWDILLIGSAHTDHRNKINVSGNVWECWWPLTTHAYIVRIKAVQTLLETQEYAWAPIDISLTHRTYPLLRVYTVLPRLCYQEWTHLDP